MTRPQLEEADQRRLDDFRAFYDVVVSVRDQIRGPPPGAVRTGTPASLDVETIRQRLRSKLEDLGYGKAPPKGAEVVDPGYVMTAMADEVLIMDCGQWPGCDAWRESPLERTVYGTRMAGDRVFDAAARFKGGSRDKTGTAILILASLLLGFRGRNRTADGVANQAVRDLQDQLYEHVYGVPWSPKQAMLVDTTPDARTGSSVRRLPTLWPWLAAIVVIFVAYWPLSHLLWRLQTQHVAELAEVIIASQPASPAQGAER